MGPGLRMISLAIAAVLGAQSQASAAERVPFDPSSFVAAQTAGLPILVEISAVWCPTCWAQKPIIDRIAAQPGYDRLIIFEVDFDRQKPVVRALGARMQSTLIAFSGLRETGRSVGDTNPTSIEALFSATLAD